MDEQRARELLEPIFMFGLYGDHLSYVHEPSDEVYFAWSTNEAEARFSDDISFTADQLEAIAWWMRNKAKP
jgi:hypothetical protein